MSYSIKSLIAELRPTMPEEVLRAWALDAAAALSDAQAKLAEREEEFIRRHTQTIMDATRGATIQALADAEVRGYERKVTEVARRAAEKGWDECHVALSYYIVRRDLNVQGLEQPSNPYRVEQIGEK